MFFSNPLTDQINHPVPFPGEYIDSRLILILIEGIFVILAFYGVYANYFFASTEEYSNISFVNIRRISNLLNPSSQMISFLLARSRSGLLRTIRVYFVYALIFYVIMKSIQIGLADSLLDEVSFSDRTILLSIFNAMTVGLTFRLSILDRSKTFLAVGGIFRVIQVFTQNTLQIIFIIPRSQLALMYWINNIPMGFCTIWIIYFTYNYIFQDESGDGEEMDLPLSEVIYGTLIRTLANFPKILAQDLLFSSITSDVGSSVLIIYISLFNVTDTFEFKSFLFIEQIRKESILAGFSRVLFRSRSGLPINYSWLTLVVFVLQIMLIVGPIGAAVVKYCIFEGFQFYAIPLTLFLLSFDAFTYFLILRLVYRSFSVIFVMAFMIGIYTFTILYFPKDNHYLGGLVLYFLNMVYILYLTYMNRNILDDEDQEE